MSNQFYTRWDRPQQSRRKRGERKKFIDATSGANMFGIIREIDRKYRLWLRRRGLRDEEISTCSFGGKNYVPDQ